jgi:hypothetical protein
MGAWSPFLAAVGKFEIAALPAFNTEFESYRKLATANPDPRRQLIFRIPLSEVGLMTSHMPG